MSQDRRLDELVSKICISSDGHTPSGCGTGCELDTRELVKQAILEVMRGCVPEERNTISEKPMNKLKEHERIEFISNFGFNVCRSWVLRRIEEMGK